MDEGHLVRGAFVPAVGLTLGVTLYSFLSYGIHANPADALRHSTATIFAMAATGGTAGLLIGDGIGYAAGWLKDSFRHCAPDPRAPSTCAIVVAIAGLALGIAAGVYKGNEINQSLLRDANNAHPALIATTTPVVAAAPALSSP